MATCILHVGMHKTGSSSIQESLYFGLEDPAFRYISLGRINAILFLEPLMHERPEEFWMFRMKRYSKDRVRSMKQRFGRRFRRSLVEAKAHAQTPIISAEDLWRAPPYYLESLREFLLAEGFEVRVIAYVRPIKSFVESAFQQSVKWGRQTFDPTGTLSAYGAADDSGWTSRLARFERIFGRDNLIIRPFVREALVGGCAVQDFCRAAGVTLDPRAVIRANDSVSADAVRFLYAYNRFHSRSAQTTFLQRMPLLKHFEDLRGEPFRLHSEVLAPLVETIAIDDRAILERYGVDISEDLRAADGGPCVREESDLFRYSRRSLDWLAETSRSRPIAAHEGVEAARAVAAQVDRIRRRPSWRSA